jgi:uncharacterized protein with PQ loop repeat
VEALGYIGGLCLALCGVPLAWATLRAGHAKGLDLGFLLLWFFGEVLTIIYILPKQDYPLLLNYGLNLTLLIIILRYKLWPRKQN